MDTDEMDKIRLKANMADPNAEYYRNFYAYYRQLPKVRIVIDRYIFENSKKNPQEVMQLSFQAPPFNGKQQETNYNPEQQQEAAAAAAAATASQGKQIFSAIPGGGKRKSKKYRYKKTKKSKTNKRRQYRSNKRSHK